MIRPLDPDNFVADKLAWHQQIAMDPKLSMSAKAVAGLILHDLNGDRGGAWRGQKSMAACLGVCERQLRRLLNELAKSFYLQIEGANGRGRTNIYRATRPEQEDIAALQPAESRTPVTAQARKSRTQASGQSSESRTSTSPKPDTGGRQYLYDTIRFKRTPAKQLNSRHHQAVTPSPFEQAEIRNAVVSLAGEDAAISYLDPATWDPDNRRIICRSRTGHARLRDRVGRALTAQGVTIVLNDPRVRTAA